MTKDRLPHIRQMIERTLAARQQVKIGKPLLIEPIPEPLHGINLRILLTATEWKRLRDPIFEAAGHRCEICGGQGTRHPVEGDEVFSYNEETATAALRCIVAVCPQCHAVKHIGRTQQLGYEEAALDHLAIVNGWSAEQVSEHYEEAYTTWQRRSQIKWRMDFKILGDDFPTPERIEAADRRRQAKQRG